MGKLQAVPGTGSAMAAAPAGLVRPEDVSLLVDGELETERLDTVCKELRTPECVATWTCYHVIGDALRGSLKSSPGFSTRFAALLAAEPTVLAPPPPRARPMAVAWAAAATVAAVGVVGWVSMQTMPIPATVLSTARQANSVRAVSARPMAMDNEYLLVHQEYSPTTAIQGVRPYLRAVSAEEQPSAR